MGICNSKGGNYGYPVAKDNNPGGSLANNSQANNISSPGGSPVNNSLANNVNNSGENNNINPELKTMNNPVLNNNSNPGTNNNNNARTNDIIYSCIPRIENYNDLSYEPLKNHIKIYIKKIGRKQGNIGFSSNNCKEEFETLQKNIDQDKKHKEALEEGFRNLCRYADIKTYKHNSLKIQTESKYINASPITINGKILFISTQGPTENTIDDFWRMNDENDCNLIIMLCNLQEDGKEKCSNYWSVKETKNYYVELLPAQNPQDKNKNKNIEERKIKLKSKANSSEKIITQIHYTGWPDHGAPKIETGFDSFSYMIDKVDELKGNGPVVTHCSAGVGRTGTFISIYILYKEIMAQINNGKCQEIEFSIFNMVRKLKEMRLYMVQTLEQYKFIYTFINRLLQNKNI